MSKKCSGCKLFLNIDNFEKNKAKPDGMGSYCLECKKQKYHNKKKLEYQNVKQQTENLTWKRIPNFDKYEASECGKIRNFKTKKILKGSLDMDGYVVGSLSDNNNKFKGIKYHRIIAETFLENSDNKKTVNHKDKNKQNNDVLNLEWATHDEQVIHKYKFNPPLNITKTLKKIIMWNDTKTIKFNSFVESYEYLKINNLCFDEERKLHRKIFNAIHKNILTFGFYWKYDIEIYENEIFKIWNNVEISNFGRVKDKWGFIRNPIVDKNEKYKTINFNGKTFRFHRIVAELFVENLDVENNIIVNHIDGNKQNNKFDNLEWVTSSENQKHAYKTGLQTFKKKINQINIETNEIIKTWNNMNEIYNEMNFTKSGISYCLSGKYKTSQGFKWEYV